MLTPPLELSLQNWCDPLTLNDQRCEGVIILTMLRPGKLITPQAVMLAETQETAKTTVRPKARRNIANSYARHHSNRLLYN